MTMTTTYGIREFDKGWSLACNFFLSCPQNSAPLRYGSPVNLQESFRAVGSFRCAFRRQLNWGQHVETWGTSKSHFTVLTVGAQVSAFSAPSTLRASDLCRDRLLSIIRAFERFPVSYNKILVQGAADYCARALSNLDEGNDGHARLLNQIRRFTTQIWALYTQYRKRTEHGTFSLLDLQMIEDKFELIQSESSKLRVLPKLRDMRTDELVDR